MLKSYTELVLHRSRLIQYSKSSVSFRTFSATSSFTDVEGNKRNSKNEDITYSNQNQQENMLEKHRKLIYKLSMSNVHSMGWTDKAVASAVHEADLPLTLSGLMFEQKGSNGDSSLDAALVHRYMENCNMKLRKTLREDPYVNDLDDVDKQIQMQPRLSDIPQRLNFSLRTRLEMLIPYIRSKRWHEAMAIGSLPQNTIQTAHKLEELVDIILADLNTSFGEDTIQKFCYGLLHKTAIGGVYVATELHMLADESTDFADSWIFLNDRISELQSIAGIVSASESNGQLGINGTMLALSAVVGSMGSAALSLGQPLAKGVVSAAAGSLLPTIMTFMQPMQSPMPGSNPSDYQTKPNFNQKSRVYSTNSGQTTPELVHDAINNNDVSCYLLILLLSLINFLSYSYYFSHRW